MGKAIRGTSPIVLCESTAQSNLDVERLEGEALKVYLQHKLQELEEHISVLSQLCGLKLNPETGNIPRPTSPSQDNWGLFLDLSYLCAMRDAIISALNIL